MEKNVIKREKIFMKENKYCNFQEYSYQVSRRYNYKQNKSKRYKKYQKGRFLVSGPSPLQQL